MIRLPWLFVIAAFLLIIVARCISEGMFLDGTLYACIALNLKEGMCSIWELAWSATQGNPFYGHPPFGFVIQAAFFQLFGDSLFTERLHAIMLAVVQIFLIARLWSVNFRSSKLLSHLNWFPVLLWLSVPILQWSIIHNMLENIVACFATLAVLLQVLWVNSNHRLKLLYVIGSSLCILFAILSKGLIGLFPLVTPLVIVWMFQRPAFKSAWLYTTAQLVLVMAFASLVIFASPESLSFFKHYWHTQIQQTLSQELVNVENRLFILTGLFFELLVPLSLCLILAGIAWYNKISLFSHPGYIFRLAFGYLFIGVIASFPIMLSLKQARVYMVPSLPFYVIGLAAIIAPAFAQLLTQYTGRFAHKFRFFTLGLIVIAVPIIIWQSGQIKRDKVIIQDIKKISTILPPYTEVYVPKSLYKKYRLHVYLYRYGRISVLRKHPEEANFFYLSLTDYQPHLDECDCKELCDLLKIKLLKCAQKAK